MEFDTLHGPTPHVIIVGALFLYTITRANCSSWAHKKLLLLCENMNTFSLAGDSI